MLIKLLGWHWAFLPTFAAEMMPGLDLFPTWTAAVFFVTQSMSADDMAANDEGEPTRVRTSEPEILKPGPAPAPRP
jgi:hypothetical protein